MENPKSLLTTPSPSAKGRLLIVDDEIELMKALCEMLAMQGFETQGFESGEKALLALEQGEYDLLLTDLMMPGMDGISLLNAGLKVDPHLVGIIMTGQGTVPTAVDAMRSGAFDYLLKPFKIKSILPILARAMEIRRLRMENVQLRHSVAIFELSQAIAFTLDLNTISNKVADAALQQCQADEASIMLTTEDGQELFVAAVRGKGRDHILGLHVPITKGIAGWVARNRAALTLHGKVSDQRFQPIQPREGIRSAICIPLLVGSKMVGILNVNLTRSPRPLTPGHVKALTILTSVAAAGLESARLFETSERLRAFNASIIDTMDEGLVVSDQEGFVNFSNPSVQRMLGYSEQELYRKHWSDYIPESEHVRVLEQINRRVKGESNHYETYLLTRDGRLVPVLVSAIPFKQDDLVAGTLAVFTNITERKKALEALQESENRFRRLAENAPDLIYRYNFTPERGFEYVSPIATQMTGYSPEEHYADPDLGFKQVHPDDRQIMENMFSFKKKVVKPVTMRWLRKDGSQIWTEHRNVPIYDGKGELVSMEGIARDVTARIQRERELQAIAAVSSHLRTAVTRNEMLPLILDNVMDLLNAKGAALLFFDPHDGESLVELGWGEWISWTGLRFPAGGFISSVISSRQAYVNPDVLRSSRDNSSELYGDLQAVVCVPLIAQEDVIGAVWVGREKPFSPAEVRSLNAIGDIVANALQRETLFEQTGQRLQRLTALRAIDMAINASLDSRITLTILLDQVTAQLGIDAAAVLLLNRQTLTLTYAAGRGFKTKEIEATSMRLGEGYAGRAVLERQIIIETDLKAAETPILHSARVEGEGFVSYYGVPLIAKGQVKGVLEIFHRQELRPDSEWLDYLEALGTQAAIAIDNTALFDDLQRSNLELVLAYEATLEGWSKALDLRDKETEGHTQRVTGLTVKLASSMGISGPELVHVRRGALLHDIGKMGIPDAILHKPGPLNAAERAIMRKHPVYAYELLHPITYLRPALDIPYCHHEKWDGTGYPRRLASEQIPLAARIFALVDVWDALRSDRPYRAAWPIERVLKYIRGQQGKIFDPDVVESFLQQV